MTRDECPDCQAFFSTFNDIPTTLSRTKEVFDAQECNGAHTLDEWVAGPVGPLVTCDPTKENRDSPVPHDYEYVDDEYGSLGEGGSYEVWKCRRCGRVAYSMMPD